MFGVGHVGKHRSAVEYIYSSWEIDQRTLTNTWYIHTRGCVCAPHVSRRLDHVSLPVTSVCDVRPSIDYRPPLIDWLIDWQTDRPLSSYRLHLSLSFCIGYLASRDVKQWKSYNVSWNFQSPVFETFIEILRCCLKMSWNTKFSFMSTIQSTWPGRQHMSRLTCTSTFVAEDSAAE